MRHADMALYRAKNEGRNRACIYDTAMDADLVNRKLIENDLRTAIERDELDVAYQPIVNNSGETVVGVEALCRWRHAVRGEVPPSEFIPIAENSGLIILLGEKVLRRACLDGNAWPGHHSRGQCLAAAVPPHRFRRRRRAHSGRDRLRPGAARARSHREHADRQRRHRRTRDDPPQGARRAARARRFRHRLFEPALSAPLPIRQAQDRPQLRAFDRAGRRTRPRSCTPSSASAAASA